MASLNVELYIHCRPCMSKTQMEKSLMKKSEKIVFDNDDIVVYRCPNCNHQIEIEVGVAR